MSTSSLGIGNDAHAAEGLDARRRVLAGLGGRDEALSRVLEYCAPFDDAWTEDPPQLPLEDEASLADWRGYVREAATAGFHSVQARLPQLRIPIREGAASSAAYAAVMRRGEPFEVAAFGGELELGNLDGIRVSVHEHPMGALPVLACADRADFETLFRALACRNEPKPVGPAVNAQLVAGILNWDRVTRHRRAFEQEQSGGAGEGWPQEMSRVATMEPELFFDKLMLTCVNPYSGVSAASLGLALPESAWLERSTELRVEHEFTHYATKRLCGQMRLNLFDELIADCMGTTHALGEFRAAWFLRFIGLERWPEVAPEGRLHTYRGSLDGDALRLALEVTLGAAHGVERITRRYYAPDARARFLVALMFLTLELLASEDALAWFERAYERAGRLERGSGGEAAAAHSQAKGN